MVTEAKSLNAIVNRPEVMVRNGQGVWTGVFQEQEFNNSNVQINWRVYH
jgi:hypothetical protein